MPEKSKKKNLVIFGSSRSDGETMQLYKRIFEKVDHKFYDLKALNIQPFDYEYKNKSDDFEKIARDMTQYDNIILATPVYWYTMSSYMKVFIDRLSDLITIHKDLGRKLKNKRVYVITTYGATLPVGFEEPFRQTCIYMDMEYVSCLYYYTGKHGNMALHNEDRIKRFRKMLEV